MKVTNYSNAHPQYRLANAENIMVLGFLSNSSYHKINIDAAELHHRPAIMMKGMYLRL